MFLQLWKFMDDDSKLDEAQCSILVTDLIELQSPDTTPETALEILSTTYFLPEFYKRGDKEPVVIFIAYIWFIKTRLPGACVDGIWEKILRKTVMYSKNFSISLKEITLAKKNYSWTVQEEDTQVTSWLMDALKTHTKCPNPYIRLELFRLLRIFGKDLKNMNRDRSKYNHEHLSFTFIHTISEILPHHLYPRGDVDEVLFDVHDFNYVLNSTVVKLREIVSTDINQQLNKTNEVHVISKETQFLSNCIQLIGVYAVIASFNPHPMAQILHLNFCCNMLNGSIGRLVCCEENLLGMRPFVQFRYVVSLPPFSHYIIETVKDLTKSIINNKLRDKVETEALMYQRDKIARDFGICTKTQDLPRLLLNHQLHSSTLIRQQSLLENLIPLYNDESNLKEKKSEEDSDNDSIEDDDYVFSFMFDSDYLSTEDSDHSQGDSDSSHTDSDY